MQSSEILFNRAGNLRSGWRLAVFLCGIFLFFAFVGAIVGALIYVLPIGLTENNLLGFVAQSLILLTASVVVGYLCGQFLEHLPFRALGCWFVKNWAKDLSFGLLAGALTVGSAALMTVAFGATVFRFNRTADASAIGRTLLVSLLVFTLAAAAEETLFRGYVLQTFARAQLVWFAVALTAALFAYTHTNNPSANYLSSLNTLLAGVWFAVAYLKTRTLWFAFGLHLAWNWVLGAVLGISVSGINEITPAPLLLPTYTGSTVLTGGDYGIEGGVACTVALLVSTVSIWFAPFLKPTEEMLALTGGENANRYESTKSSKNAAEI